MLPCFRGRGSELGSKPTSTSSLECHVNAVEWDPPEVASVKEDRCRDPQDVAGVKDRCEVFRFNMLTAEEVCQVAGSHEAGSHEAKKGVYKTCECRIGTSMVPLVIDLGAKVSALTGNTYKGVLSNFPLETPKAVLNDCSGSPIPAIGIIYSSVEYNEHRLVRFSFYITSVGADVMGVDLFDDLGSQVVLGLTDGQGKIARWRSGWPGVSNGLGEPRRYEHAPLLLSNVVSVQQFVRWITLALRKKVSAELLQVLKEKIFERIDSSQRISNLVITRKNSGALLRNASVIALGAAVGEFGDFQNLLKDIEVFIHAISGRNGLGQLRNATC
eukprot:m.215969 g.215969  ORF g.215969 m.215969 type:complete len:329 (+) comp39844_c0_seq46:1462-2448(+)